MSLRMLFTIMALVSSGMVAAVIYTKAINPPKDGHGSVAQRRAIDRLCYNECNLSAKEDAKKATDTESLEAMARACMTTCIEGYLAEADRRGQTPTPPAAPTSSSPTSSTP